MHTPGLQRIRLAIPLALVAALAIFSTALAWPDLVEGIPHNLHAGGTAGYYLWHTDQGYFLATTTPYEAGHLFTGTMETDGRFADVHLLRAEGPDTVVVRENDQRLRFSFRTRGDIDGLTVDIVGGTYVGLTLLIDGEGAATRRIFMGQRAINPQVNPVILYR